MSRPTTYTHPLTLEQAEQLRKALEERTFDFEERPYTLFFARTKGITVAVYEKGPKVVVQGGKAREFVEFVLEPEILGEVRLGYEEHHHPDWFEPHFGIDESGKGDYFGPLVIAGVYSDAEMVRTWLAEGIQDSKRIVSAKRIHELADLVRNTRGVEHSVVVIGPLKYNELYNRIGNLNRLLAWGHARVIENLAQKRPDCPRALSDQFAKAPLIQRALQEGGRKLRFEQRTKAESDPAVAAASILAREAFVDWFVAKEKEMGLTLPKGGGPAVVEAAIGLVKRFGSEKLDELAKTHFRITELANSP